MGYNRFCKSYQQHVLFTGLASRAGHKAGQSVEVDWSGPTRQLTESATGATTRVYLFEACLPFSRYAFVEPALDMRQDTWPRAHVAMFDVLGGTTARFLPDDLKTGVIKHPREGEIVLNHAYREMAAHYSAAVLPGRVRKPKDKASVENTVAHVETWVIAGLRDQRFATLAELQVAIGGRVEAYNLEPFQKRAGSRANVFATEEKPLLRPLPAAPYEISQGAYGLVGRYGHVAWAKNLCSVPYPHVGAKVDLRVTDTMVEIHLGNERLSSHLLAGPGGGGQ